MVKRHDDGEPYFGAIKRSHNPVEKAGNLIIYHPPVIRIKREEDDINEDR